MENTKIQRINELARLAKERELTQEELNERDTLRKEYIAEWRKGAEQVLDNTYIQTPDGKSISFRRRSNEQLCGMPKRRPAAVFGNGAGLYRPMHRSDKPDGCAEDKQMGVQVFYARDAVLQYLHLGSVRRRSA